MKQDSTSNLFVETEIENFIDRLKINLVSHFFPFTKEQILHYKLLLNFDRYHLMDNDQIEWDSELLDELNDQIDWSAIWKLNKINLDFDFFEKYKDRINFKSTQLSRNIEWSNKLLSKYGDCFDWSRSLIMRTQLSTIDNLRHFKDDLNWDVVSERINIEFTDEVLEEFSDKWNWTKLSLNKNLPLSTEFICRYLDKVDFASLSKNPKCLEIIYKTSRSKKWNWNQVIINPGIRYNKESFEFIFPHFKKEYEEGKHPSIIKKTPAINAFLKEVFFWHHNDLSYFFSEEFIDYLPKMHYSRSWNTKLSLELVEKYKFKLNFNDLNFIRMHADIITIEFIEENLDLFDFASDSFYHIQASIDYLEKHQEKILLSKLVYCKNFNWSWEYIIGNYGVLKLYDISQNKGIYDRLIKDKLSKKEILQFVDHALKKGYKNNKYQVLF